MQTCRVCNRTLPLVEGFYRDRSKTTGRCTICKDCTREKQTDYLQRNPRPYIPRRKYPNCRVCGKPNPPRHRYCSRKCFQRARTRREATRIRPARPCTVCGQEFIPGNGIQTICSNACFRESKGLPPPKAKKQNPILTKTCPWCNKQFNTKHSRRRFCTNECSKAYFKNELLARYHNDPDFNRHMRDLALQSYYKRKAEGRLPAYIQGRRGRL